MALYEHGIEVVEDPTEVDAPAENQAGITIIFGTAPVNTLKDPEGAVNKLFLVSTFAEAKAAVGYNEDYSYTLNQAIDAFFKIFAIGPVVICNVLDPAKHTKAVNETLEVKDGQVTTEATGVLAKGLTVKDGETAMEAGSDYTAENDDTGHLVITLIKTGVTSVSVEGQALDTSKVKDSDIVGSYDAETGKKTGIELARDVYPLFQVMPGRIIAPGYSKSAAVGLALNEKCSNLNGMFSMDALLDIDTTRAKKYSDAAKIKDECSYNGKHMSVLWPCAKVNGKPMFFSALLAAQQAYADHSNDDVPYISPSNKALRCSGACLEDGTEVVLDMLQANELNSEGIVTIVNLNGWKAWGNNTAVYPDSTDPKDRWISCRNFFTWWGNSFAMDYISSVDDNIDKKKIQSIVDAENVKGNALVSESKCAGAKIEYREEDNPEANVLNGHIVFRQKLAPYPPMEHIQDRLEFDTSMLMEALNGGES